MLGKILTGLFFIGLGAAFAVLAYLHTRRFVDGAVPAVGEVVRLQEHHDDGVTFPPSSVEFTETTSSNPPGYCVGDQVRILYDLMKPVSARLTGVQLIRGQCTYS